jgi:hypothetical protein
MAEMQPFHTQWQDSIERPHTKINISMEDTGTSEPFDRYSAKPREEIIRQLSPEDQKYWENYDEMIKEDRARKKYLSHGQFFRQWQKENSK